MTVRKAIFLDRDGVLNEAIVKNGKPYPPATLDELVIPADAQASLKLLKSHGFLLIGATNQPDVARGKTAKATVESLNAHLMTMLPLDEIRVCYHDDHDGCTCRKPQPGLLVQAAHDYQLDLSQCVMIGDRYKDIEAGQNAPCKTIWLKKGYQEPQPKQAPDFTTTTLMQAAQWVIENMNSIGEIT